MTAVKQLIPLGFVWLFYSLNELKVIGSFWAILTSYKEELCIKKKQENIQIRLDIKAVTVRFFLYSTTMDRNIVSDS